MKEEVKTSLEGCKKRSGRKSGCKTGGTCNYPVDV